MLDRGGGTARAFWPPIAAALLLVAIIALRFAFADVDGIMLFAVVPIALLGMMLGARAGVLTALVASAAYLVWAATDASPDKLDYVNQPLTFFLLGGLSGYFAHGALGDYDWRRASAVAELRRAMDDDQLRMHYQPIVRRDGRLLGVEALVRWQHPEHGLLPPARFIGVAESHEDTNWRLALHTLSLATREVQGAEISGDALVAVNLAPGALLRAELPEQIVRVAEAAGLPLRRLAVEVTEGAIAAGDDSIAEVLERIRRLGVGLIAIDDFGIGHSSLARLGRLPIDALKIDRALIADVAREDTRAIVHGIVELAHAIDLTVIAEGVEDERAFALMREMGCDAVQGFHLSRPLPAADLDAWVALHATA